MSRENRGTLLKAAPAEWELPAWYLKAYCALVIAVFSLLALGGSVRVMKAGLSCPDWPLCFGSVIPDYHPQVYFEFIHRVVAGAVSLVTLTLQWILFRSRAPRRLKYLAGFSLALLATQIVFGGLTVTLLLKSGVVETHLMLGTGFFATLLWIYLSLKGRGRSGNMGPRWLRAESIFVGGACYGQIFLGGMMAANFASLVCIDFPTCHGEWFPTFSGIIGLHVIHRLGAYCLFTVVLANWLILRKYSGPVEFRNLARILFFCICGQIGLGISNVLFLTPPLIAVAHLALGVGILSVAVRQIHLSFS